MSNGPRGIAKQIKQLLRREWSYNAIAKELKCSKGTVAYHAQKIGRAKGPRGFYKRIYLPENVIRAADGARSISQILLAMNVPVQTGAYAKIKAILTSSGLPIPDGRVISKREVEQRRISFIRSLREYPEGVNVKTHEIRLGLIRYGLKEKKCYECEGTIWRGRDMPLELHHQNGIRRDCRIGNLSLLCPNCHAQTDTYCGKNVAAHRKKMAA